MFVDVLSYLVISQEKDQSTPLLSNYLYCKLCAAIPGISAHSQPVCPIYTLLFFRLVLFPFSFGILWFNKKKLSKVWLPN